MFNNTYSPVGSPLKKNIIENSSPVSSPLKHPRSEFNSNYVPNYMQTPQVLGQPVEIIQGKLPRKLKLYFRQTVLGVGCEATSELQERLFL